MGGVRCAAKGCKNCMKNDGQYMYHRFPSMKDRCIEWLKACGRHDLLNTPIEAIYRNFRICSIHFENKMYCNPEKTRLLPQAMPTLFNLDYELTEISINPNKTTCNYEEPQRTSTPASSENCHLESHVNKEATTSMTNENSLATTDRSTCSTVSTSSQTTQQLSVNSFRHGGIHVIPPKK